MFNCPACQKHIVLNSMHELRKHVNRHFKYFTYRIQENACEPIIVVKLNELLDYHPLDGMLINDNIFIRMKYYINAKYFFFVSCLVFCCQLSEFSWCKSAYFHLINSFTFFVRKENSKKFEFYVNNEQPKVILDSFDQ